MFHTNEVKLTAYAGRRISAYCHSLTQLCYKLCIEHININSHSTLIELEELPKTGSHFPWLIKALDKILFHLELPKCGMYFLII